MNKNTSGGDAITLFQALLPLVCLTAWTDLRNAKTLTWMLVGLLQSGTVSLSAWISSVTSRATKAQSTERRFRRALDHLSRNAHRCYADLIVHALRDWGDARITLALDTSRLWDHWCLIRIAVVYRGRAIPMSWRVIRHQSSVVNLDAMHPVLVDARMILNRLGIRDVRLLADRGFVDMRLLTVLQAYGWHYRIRAKQQLWITDTQGKPLGKVGTVLSQHGQPVYVQDVFITKKRFGPVCLAGVHAVGAREPWFILSDEPCGLETFAEYGERFQIEEGFLDDKSAGFQLEASRLRDTPALDALLLVLAVGTLLLHSEGTETVEAGERQTIDPHWQRGWSYFRIGRNAVRFALSRGKVVFKRLRLSSVPDPCPSRRRSSPITLIRLINDSS